jgi:hypothetical protein
MMMRWVVLAVLVLVPMAMVRASEIGFDEAFNLAKDRRAAAANLIPGTEEFYFYHALLAQHQGNHAEVKKLLEQWVGRLGETSRAREIMNRQAMLEFGTNPPEAANYLRSHRSGLNLQFNHQRKQEREAVRHPQTLDAKLLSWDFLSARARGDSSDLSGFELAALERISRDSLNEDQNRHLVRRLTTPDFPNLVRLVIEELSAPRSGGFGSLPIHQNLTREQLEECRRLRPQLIHETNFVDALVRRLQPGEDVDWRSNQQEKTAYLTRLWDFVQGLPPVHASLKVHVLYHLLDHERRQGSYSKSRFLEYIRLPRPLPYTNSEYLRRQEFRDIRVNMHQDFSSVTGLPIVGSEEALLRDFLDRLLRDAKDEAEFAPFIESNWLRDRLAETKLLWGIGDAEKWFSLLQPDQVQRLKDQIELDFVPSNREYIPGHAPVALELVVKNVRTLIVKVFRINAFNFYRDRQKEVGTDIDLDGLVANEERLMTYEQPDIRRHTERFEFPELINPGVYVIEFIGNGKSSRALVRKGGLFFAQRPGSAGHIFTVLAEDRSIVTDAVLWLDGREFAPDQRGEIIVPFSTNPRTQSFILQRGELASLHSFPHEAESYELTAGVVLEPEALIEGKEATALLRPELLLNGRRLDLAMLKEPIVSIQARDREGVVSTREVTGLKLDNHQETPITFKVPERLAEMTITLRGKVDSLSHGKPVDVSSGRSVAVNGLEMTDQIEQLLVRNEGGTYHAELRGKTGEPKVDRALQLEIKHRLFTRTVNCNLQTNNAGRVTLGTLEDVEWVQVRSPAGITLTWSPVRPWQSRPASVHGVRGQPVRVPVLYPEDGIPGSGYSVLELRQGVYVADLTSEVRLDAGCLIFDDLAAGTYEVRLKRENALTTVRLVDGRPVGRWVVSNARLLSAGDEKPLFLAKMAADAAGKEVVIDIGNPTPKTRVHVMATRFLPAMPLYRQVGRPAWPEPLVTRLNSPVSRYLSGRTLADELRYVLERRYTPGWAGNMLKRPSLLLNPWNLRKTSTSVDGGRGGDAWGAVPEPAPEMGRMGGRGPREEQERRQAGAGHEQMLFDFLPDGALLMSNLQPDEKGRVKLAVDALGARRHLFVWIGDGRQAAGCALALPAVPEDWRDRTLVRGLDPAQHVAEQKRISPVPPGEKFVLADVATGKMEVYDSLATVYSLFLSLNRDAHLVEFGFILNWPNLPRDEKTKLYSKYACHELNVFLARKDPAFFKEVIQPYLKHKREKTFIDRYLLEEDLREFTAPWAFGQLNVVERILLHRRLQGGAPGVPRHIQDRFDLLPPDPDRFQRLFDAALKGSALETGDRFGFDKAQKAMAPPPPPRPQMVAAPRMAAPPAPSAGPMGLAKARSMEMKKKDMVQLEEADDELMANEAFAADMDSFESEDLASAGRHRSEIRQFFRQLDTTEEWVENQYYRVPIERHTAEFIKVNGFWRDFAAAPANQPFLSTNLAEATNSFAEMMLALAMLDLPLTPGKTESRTVDSRFELVPASGAVVFHKEIRPTELASKSQMILAGQNFFAVDDRYKHEGNERIDKFITEEFQTHRVYGCQVVITNPTSTRRKVEVLIQIPRGAMPVGNGFVTRSMHQQLEAYSTQTLEYVFYFPSPGTFAHFPVHVAENQQIIATTEPLTFNVVDTLTLIDKTAWAWVSQNADDEALLAYLAEHNIDRLDLEQIAWRMRDAKIFRRVLDLLKSRHVYHHPLWSYGVMHADAQAMGEYLAHSDFATRCGSTLDSPLLKLDPVTRRLYQHKEYWPLVNARAHQLGKTRKILNSAFHAQYHAFLADLKYHPNLTDSDRLAVVYYLLLQDRIDEARQWFTGITSLETRATLAGEYCAAWLAFSAEDPQRAMVIAERYKDHPVDRWRLLFRDVLAQAAEISGGATTVVDKDDRDQQQAVLADTTPSLEVKVENRQVALTWKNLKTCRVNYYAMDLELLFSRNPFVQEVSDQFAIIHPNVTQEIPLPEGKNTLQMALPDTLRDQNLMVEVVGGGLARRQVCYPHSLQVLMQEVYGQVQVLDAATGKPLPKVYIKVFGRQAGGSTAFFKDGYTDLRGRFDYASLSTDDLDRTERLAIMIMSEKNGSLVREAAPPKR